MSKSGKPKPNYRLFRRIKEAILANPKRVDMGNWVYKDDECGTVGCIAGWACILAGNPKGQWKNDGFNGALRMAGTGFSKAGRELLGLTDDEADALFVYWDCSSTLAPLEVRLDNANAGTKAYARVVAKAIDRFVEYLKEDRKAAA